MLTIPAKDIRGKDFKKMTVDQIVSLAANKRDTTPVVSQKSSKMRSKKATVRLPKAGATYGTERMRSKLEVEYAAYLDSLVHVGEVLAWRYEPMSLRLADRTTYTPDFLLILPDGTLELHETKGFWREKAWIKYKVAAEQYPWFVFAYVMKSKGGTWQIKKAGEK